MSFQTIFYIKATGRIVNVVPNKYIRSKAERARFCPGCDSKEISFLYFKASEQVAPDTHKVKSAGPFHPPYIMDASGIPLVFTDKRREFLAILEKFPTIIVGMYLSMGDNLLRASAVAEAQRKYPATKFLCDVMPEYREVMALCPDITLFGNFRIHGLDPGKCAKVLLAEGPLWDPRGPDFGKASLYGLYLNLPHVPYNTRLVLPPDFDFPFASFAKQIGLREDGHNVIFHLRSKDWSDKCWEVKKIDELARLIRSVYDCTVFYLGEAKDMPDDRPDLVNLCGKTTWLQTVYLLTKASKIFCVDSAVMHLCRALGIPYYCLWGHTTPNLILSQEPGPGDIMAPPKKGRVEMQDITPLQVFDRAFHDVQSSGAYWFDPKKDVSDFGAQEIIFKFFRERPPVNKQLVDIGAHGKNSSNTYGLLTLGWKGLMIEANPERARVCRKDFAGLDVKVLNIGVSDEAGRMPLYMHRVVGSSSLLASWDPHEHTGKRIMVSVEPVDKVFKEHQIPDDLDFLSVDVEGLDYRVVKKIFEDTRCRPRLIITEAASYEDPLGFFGHHGYEFLIKLKQDQYGNLIFFRK
jgi:FkbM family methyltransferase